MDAGYGDARALTGATLSVGTGEIVALLGPNGAGKSTLLKCVAGLVRPWKGAILWDGADTIVDRYRIDAIPQIFLVGRDGVIRYAGGELPERYDAMLESALAQDASPRAADR